MLNLKLAGTSLAALALACVLPLGAQTVKQDMSNAGHDTSDASKQVAHKTSNGTKKAYHKTVRGTKSAAHTTKRDTTIAADKAATGTRNVGRRIEGKQPVPNNPSQTH